MSKGKFLAFLTIFAVVALALSLIAASPPWGQSVSSTGAESQKYPSAQGAKGKACYPPTPRWWTGYNSKLSQYYVAPGYPPYDAHPRYLGELSGSWYQIGKQYGDKAGDMIRLTYEGWYKELIAIQGTNQNIVDYVHQEDAYYKDLVPEALQMMKGIAAGAKKDLDQSIYADKMTNYEKILMINSYFGMQAKPPVATSASAASPAASGAEDVHSCSGAVIFGNATKDGKLIHVSSEDQHFFPQEYLVTFIANPSDKRAHRYTITDTAGEIGSEHAINDHGVSVSGYAGGGINIASPTVDAPFSGYRRPGLDWQVGDFYAAAFASNAKEAVELLTVGRPEYRHKSGKKIVIGKCRMGANWVVSDKHHEAYVVESIPADQNGVARYAVRRPGDMGEVGANYIVSTNNVESNYSCDENNVCNTSHPLSQHGHYSLNPTYYGLSGSGQRFWTLMWLVNNNYGSITPAMVKQWRTAHFIYDMGGTKHDTLTYQGQEYPAYLSPGVGTLCWHATSSSAPGVDPFTGINIYVSLSTPHNLTVYRTKGRPCEWVGPWDSLSLKWDHHQDHDRDHGRGPDRH